MPEKKKSTVRQVTDAVKDAASSVAHAAQAHVIQPVGAALGLAGDKKDEKPGEGAATPPAQKPAAKHGSAARMMTRSVPGKGPAAGKGKAQRAADATRPSQKPAAGAGRKGPRRGASKGR
jgi:hypothetical protein